MNYSGYLRASIFSIGKIQQPRQSKGTLQHERKVVLCVGSLEITRGSQGQKLIPQENASDDPQFSLVGIPNISLNWPVSTLFLSISGQR